MVKLPTENLTALIESVLAKHQWTQTRLSQELNLTPEAISRWKSGTKIHRGHYEELLRLNKDNIPMPTEIPKPTSIEIPFSVTIPRSSITISTDKNGDINIKGLLVAALNNKEAL